jgi:DtxR family Mn-dependent transcriptional regulator
VSWRNKERQRTNHRHRHRHGIVTSITELKPGQKGIIASIQGNRKVAQRLADLGLTPETAVYMLKTAPLNGPIEVAVRGSKLAIGREIAENILIRVKGS